MSYYQKEPGYTHGDIPKIGIILANLGTPEKPTSAAFRNVFPIPQEQIDASGGSLTQNPGY